MRYAVRPRPVLKYFGQLCFVLALLMCVPLGVALLGADFQVSWRYGLVIAAVLTLGFGLKRLPAPKQLQTNEAIVITALVFLFTPLVMTWPTMASMYIDGSIGLTAGGIKVLRLLIFLRLFQLLFKRAGIPREKGALDLPENTRALFYYRDDGFNFIDEEIRFKKGDEIVLLTTANTCRN